MLSYYHNLSSTASVTYTQIIHGIIQNNSGTFNQSQWNITSNASETFASGSKNFTNIVRPSSTITFYAPILISFSTAGNMTNNCGMFAIRIA